MSGIPAREAKQRRYEHNLKLLELDENVIKSKSKASWRKVDIAYWAVFSAQTQNTRGVFSDV